MKPKLIPRNSGEAAKKLIAGQEPEVLNPESISELTQQNKLTVNSISTSVPNTVGVAIGVTLNMGAYQGLRIDTWTTDYIQPDESRGEAFDRLATELLNKITQLHKENEDAFS